MVQPTLTKDRTEELINYAQGFDKFLDESDSETVGLFKIGEVLALLDQNLAVHNQISNLHQSNLVAHAQHELALDKALEEVTDDEDPMAEYAEAIRQGVLDLISLFASQGHSGMSAGLTLDIFNKLARFQALSPITDSSGEWQEISYEGKTSVYQNKRQSNCFSTNYGVSYYNLDEKRVWVQKIIPRQLYTKLPVWVKYPMHKSALSTISRVEG